MSLPLLGNYFQNKCSPESCGCIASTFGVSIPTVESTKKTASQKNKIKRGDPDFLTLWQEKVASYSLLSSPTSGSSVTDSYHKSATSFPLLELVHLQVEGLLLRAVAFASLFSYSLACFLCPESPNELLRYSTTGVGLFATYLFATHTLSRPDLFAPYTFATCTRSLPDSFATCTFRYPE